jgi:hypothetical protein
MCEKQTTFDTKVEDTPSLAFAASLKSSHNWFGSLKKGIRLLSFNCIEIPIKKFWARSTPSKHVVQRLHKKSGSQVIKN